MSAAWRGLLQQQLASPVLFDAGVEAARNACVAGASIAAAAITAAAFYDNPLTGLPALGACMARLRDHAPGLLTRDGWCHAFAPGVHPHTGDPGFAPGFGFVSPQQAQGIVAACEQLAGSGPRAPWPLLADYLRLRSAIEPALGALNACGLAALAFCDRGVELADAERWYLSWRIETAVAEAQRTRAHGVAAFPFFTEALVYEGPYAPCPPPDLAACRREVGLD